MTASLGRGELDRRFGLQEVDAGQVEAMRQIRYACWNLAKLVAQHCPPGREASLAYTHIETAMFYANAAVARGGAPGHTPSSA